MLIRCWMALSILLCACAALSAAPAAPPPEVLSDASLCDILFLDPDRGFAVGERGAIWRTEDGGRHWRLVPSPVGCRWESIYFVDAERGWIVGGAPQQVTHQSHGAVLRTLDGGRTWKQVPKLVLPALKQVKFFDARQGVAVGHASEFAPAGIFRTSDGGQTWAPQPGKSLVGWESAAFLAPQRGVVAGDGAHVALVNGGEPRA